MGDLIDIYPYEGKVCRGGTDEVITAFELKTPVILDEVCAGGRIPLIIGRGITTKARIALGQDSNVSDIFKLPEEPKGIPKGYTLRRRW